MRRRDRAHPARVGRHRPHAVPGLHGPSSARAAVSRRRCPTIKYPNHKEAIKEWTNVLGLKTDPDMTDMNVPLGTHQATRKRWQNDCGFVTLDAFTSLGGDHGPSDALFKAEYVIPFLGLDKVGAVDPESEQCKPGAGGAGGMAGAGGAMAAGGSGVGGASSAGAAGTGAGGALERNGMDQ